MLLKQWITINQTSFTETNGHNLCCMPKQENRQVFCFSKSFNLGVNNNKLLVEQFWNCHLQTSKQGFLHSSKWSTIVTDFGLYERRYASLHSLHLCYAEFQFCSLAFCVNFSSKLLLAADRSPFFSYAPWSFFIARSSSRISQARIASWPCPSPQVPSNFAEFRSDILRS